MLLLSEIVKDVNLKVRNSEEVFTYINVCMYYLDCIENECGDINDIKYRCVSLFNQIKRDNLAFRSYNYWFNKNVFLSERKEDFEDFVKTRLNKSNENYIELSKYTKREKEIAEEVKEVKSKKK